MTAEHRFPCDQCGADLRFDPDRGALLCDHCGHTEPVGAGPWQQTLLIVEKDEEGRLAERRTIGVAFVPLVAGDA